MRDVSIIGLGQTRVGEHWDKSLRELSYDALAAAMRDAKVERVDGLYVGKFLNTDQIIRTVAEKTQLGESTGAIAVDMESLAVARVCAERKVRFMAVRVISDDMSKDLPAEVLTVFGSSGFVRAGAVLSALWKRPSARSHRAMCCWFVRAIVSRSTVGSRKACRISTTAC